MASKAQVAKALRMGMAPPNAGKMGKSPGKSAAKPPACGPKGKGK